VIAPVIGLLVVLVITAIVWVRVSKARSADKSVETYERALGVLGEVSKRTESTGFRILPHDETGRPHVGMRTDHAGGEAPAGRRDVRSRGQGPLASSRLPPAGEPKLRFSLPGRRSEEAPAVNQQTGGQERDDLEAGALQGAVLPAASDADAQARARARGRVPGSAATSGRVAAYKSQADRRRQLMARRAATGTVAVVAVVAVVVAAISLSGGGGHHATGTTTTVRRGSGGRTTTTTTTLATTLAPTSVSPSGVSFAVGSGGYTLAFQATGGACWVGIENSTAGPWLFSETLHAGQSATYKGSGALIMRLGAPAYLGLTVNGLVAELPSGVTQSYDVEFTPAAG